MSKFKIDSLSGIDNQAPASLVNTLQSYMVPMAELEKFAPPGSTEPTFPSSPVDPTIMDKGRAGEVVSVVADKMQNLDYLATYADDMHHFTPFFKTYPNIGKGVFEENLAFVKNNPDIVAGKTSGGSSSSSSSSCSVGDD